jgi:hypothetical protein
MSAASGSSGSYSLQITQLALDAADPPQVAYVLTVDVGNHGASPWSFNPLYFRLVTNDSQVHESRFTFSGFTLLQAASLSPGTQASGLIAFTVSPGEIPTALEYNDTLTQSTPLFLMINTPQVSSWISHLPEVSTVELIPSYYDAYTFASATLSSNQTYFFTGQRVTASFTLLLSEASLLAGPADTVYITSVNDSAGVPMTVAPAEPIPLIDGSALTIDVSFVAPSACLTPSFVFTVTISPTP